MDATYNITHWLHKSDDKIKSSCCLNYLTENYIYNYFNFQKPKCMYVLFL